MALGFGKSHSNSSNTSTENYNKTTTPTNPQWVTDSAQAFTGKIGDLLNQDPHSFFAGPQSLNQSLFGQAAQLGQSGADALHHAGGLLDQFTGAPANTASYNPANPYFASPAGYNPAMMGAAHVGPVATADGATAYGGIGSYLNPFSRDVANTTLQQMGQALGIAQNGIGQNAQMAGGYGGSRQGIAQGLTNSQFFKDAGGVLSNLNLQGFNTALGAANSDADRAQQANLANAAARNQAGLTQAGFDQQANINNQNADNTAWSQGSQQSQQAALQNAQLGTQNSQFNSTLGAQNGQFNAGQQDIALNRLYNGAGMYNNMGQYGLGLLSNAGGTQQDLAQQQAGAPLSTLGLLSGSYSGLPLNLFNGSIQNGTSTGTSKGSNTGYSAGLTFGK